MPSKTQLLRHVRVPIIYFSSQATESLQATTLATRTSQASTSPVNKSTSTVCRGGELAAEVRAEHASASSPPTFQRY